MLLQNQFRVTISLGKGVITLYLLVHSVRVDLNLDHRIMESKLTTSVEISSERNQFIQGKKYQLKAGSVFKLRKWETVATCQK